MRELTHCEAIDELCSLDGSNGWGVAPYRPDVLVQPETLVDAVVELVGRYGTYPIAKSKKSDDFWLLIVREPSGKFSLLERHEASMLNFKVGCTDFVSLRECAHALVSRMFEAHINGVSVQGGSGANKTMEPTR